MSKETAPSRETPSAKFIRQTEVAYSELVGHAVWNVSMPLETPLRWYLGEYEGEDTPRYHELWMLPEEGATIYLRRILRAVEPEDGVWYVGAREPSNQEGVDSTYTHATVLESGRVLRGQTRYKVSSEGNDICVGGDWDLSKHGRSKLLPHLTELLEQAVVIMPNLQREFMQKMSRADLERAALFQGLGSLSLRAPQAIETS